MPEWTAILATAYEGREWKVGAPYASMVSTGIWFSAMALGEYDLAELTVKRCLTHPRPFERDSSAKLPTMLLATRFVRDRSAEVANALSAQIGCGIYRPGVMARTIFHSLSGWMEPFRDDDRELDQPVTDEARSLARNLAIALRASKRQVKASEHILTWDDFGCHLTASMGWKIHEVEEDTTDALC